VAHDSVLPILDDGDFLYHGNIYRLASYLYFYDRDAPVHPRLLHQQVHHRHQDKGGDQLGYLEDDVPNRLIVSV